MRWRIAILSICGLYMKRISFGRINIRLTCNTFSSRSTGCWFAFYEQC
jgi:hypothetical protein